MSPIEILDAKGVKSVNTFKSCPKCQAIFAEGKWTTTSQTRKPKRAREEKILCPGCERIEKRRVDGVVYLKGAFLKEHSQEALNLINNVAERKRSKNIAARIFSIEQNYESIIVQTTEKTLAERIGKEFEKAFHGELNIKWLEDAEFARVHWERN